MLHQKKIEEDYGRWKSENDLVWYHPGRIILGVSLVQNIEIVYMS